MVSSAVGCWGIVYTTYISAVVTGQIHPPLNQPTSKEHPMGDKANLIEASAASADLLDKFGGATMGGAN